jgi:hypothetical protein
VALDHHRRVSGDAILANITTGVEVVPEVFGAHRRRHEDGEGEYGFIRETHVFKGACEPVLCEAPGCLEVDIVEFPVFDILEIEVLDRRSGAVTAWKDRAGDRRTVRTTGRIRDRIGDKIRDRIRNRRSGWTGHFGPVKTIQRELGEGESVIEG